MINPKLDHRAILAADPKSFIELLDLFEAYVASIGGTINKGHDMLREEIGAGENVALGHIFGVACDAEEMTKRLGRIRAARNTGTDVTITMTGIEAKTTAHALEEVRRCLGETESALGIVEDRLDTDDDYAALAVLSLIRRALSSMLEHEATNLHRLAVSINNTTKYIQMAGENSA
ncbi:hypothetical protein [Paracoccus pantotrophus]|uniref:hypothetical protein n=1 Tax=Paracoccus pantotrophus TaxID=82367 RepID=UPI0008E22981|nr:hypothetical protein [Paracoccus pantotrophus]MDF3855294.1 hypothetical protein [Paracoccus pantotrophus]SFO67252.1 hypothetical protein SAMN04244567_02694 [Paracoccus pantotrophus]